MKKKLSLDIRKKIHAFGMLTLLLGQMLLPFSNVGLVNASSHNIISVSTHEGQLAPSGNWSSGNITEYAEGQSINFRFTLTSSGATDSDIDNIMQVEFRERDNDCLFFTDSFQLGTIENISGVSPTVTLNDSVVQPSGNLASGRDWIQKLKVDFAAAGSAVVNYTLTLSNEAGDCSGSSQHSILSNGPGGHQANQFGNIGSQKVPVPASSVLILPSITITKTVTSGSALPSDFTFNVSPAINGQTDFTIDPGESSASIDNVNPDTNYVITESGPNGYTFSGGTGVNCAEVVSTVGTADGQMTVSGLAAGRPSPTNATCDFTNEEEESSITIVKEIITNNTDIGQDFNFTSDDGGVAGDIEVVNGQVQNVLSQSFDPDTYTTTEDVPDGWELTKLECVGGSDVSTSLVSGTATINLQPGEDVTCTFTNTQLATIIVEKVTEPDDTSGTFTFEGDVSGTIILPDDNQLSAQVLPDTYTSTETNDSRELWKLKEIVCDDDNSDGDVPTATATFNVGPGDVVTCTFTNTQRGTITIAKNIETIATDEPDPTFTFSSIEASLDDEITGEGSYDSGLLSSGQTYEVTEDILEGWTLTDLTCDDDSEQTTEDRTATVDLQPGEHVTCTFTNTRDTGQITIEKLLAEEPEVDETFSFNSDDGGLSGDITFVNGSVTTEPLTKEVVTGTYTSTEDVPDGWDLDSIVCDDAQSDPPNTVDVATATFNVDKDDDITCTFTNSLSELTLLIEKSVNTPTADIGDLVTYTLVVTNDSDGISENTVVTDLPPEGFAYQSASWSASSSMADHDVESDILAFNPDGPAYASPGDWGIGTMLPGESITLRYSAMVTSAVDPGEYPDLAYVQGNTLSGTQVFGNIHTEGNEENPFVGTEVLIAADTPVVAQFTPSVETTVTRLPVTGAMLVWAPSLFAFISTLLFENRRARRKGALV